MWAGRLVEQSFKGPALQEHETVDNSRKPVWRTALKAAVWKVQLLFAIPAFCADNHYCLHFTALAFSKRFFGKYYTGCRRSIRTLCWQSHSLGAGT